MSVTIDGIRHASLKQARFLACFAACGSIVKAARWAKVHRSMHFNWQKEDPEYAEKFKDAQARAARTLQDEAVRRAHEGIKKPIRYKGKIIGYDTEYSDRLLELLLKAHDPQTFRERHEVTGADGAALLNGELRVTVRYADKPVPE